MAYYSRGNEKQGYNQMKMNYINDTAKAIVRMTQEMEFAWRIQGDFKEEVDMEKYLASSRKEIEAQIEYLKGYLKPFEREEDEESN